MTTAPSLPGVPVLGHLPAFRRDVLRLLLDGRRTCGDVVRFRLGPLVVHLAAHPDHVKQVLVTHQHHYDKETRSSARIRTLTGPGLLTSSGDDWLKLRRLTQPSFHAQQVAGFVGLMADATRAMLDRWAAAANREQLDVASEMMRLTFTIVGRALFGADLSADVEAVERSATVVMGHLWHRLEAVVAVPDWLPTWRNRRFRRALRRLDEVVYRVIRNDVATGLLAQLARRRDEETGAALSETQLRNETITLLLAGHETTANALTWTWYLLSQHPDVYDRVRAEAAAVLGDRPPTAADLPRLTYTAMAFREAMRLYPPIWVMERRVVAGDALGGFDIPAGTSLILSPYVTHRHPDFWDRPDQFDPGRFSPERSVGRHPYAYFPFGGGQRLCIGNHFALAEGLVILALVAREFRLELAVGQAVTPQPGITLRVRGGLRMNVTTNRRGP
ncbi:MAG TPA: cytochrome P450 [Gemmataceae bacterium]|jgi:cytochrome P450